MVEDQGNKEEEKFELTAESEGLRYISLDQARVQALHAAVESTRGHGLPFRKVPMSFEIVDAQETAEHYLIALSFRPRGNFTGTAGREQFFIGKEGFVARRQVLALARSRRGPVPIIILSVLFAAAALFTVVGVLTARGFDRGGGEPSPIAAPSATAKPIQEPTKILVIVVAPTQTPEPRNSPLPTPTPKPLPTSTPLPTATPQSGQAVVTILPDAPARLNSANGDVVIDVAAGSVGVPTRLEIRFLSPPEVPPLPPLFRATGKAFDLTTDAASRDPCGRPGVVGEPEADDAAMVA